MRKPQAGDVAMGAFLAWEVFAPPGQTITDAMHRTLRLNPVLGRILLFYATFHAAKFLPPRADAFHGLAGVIRLQDKRLERENVSLQRENKRLRGQLNDPVRRHSPERSGW